MRSGLHNADAYTLPWAGAGHPRCSVSDRSAAAIETFARTCQSRHLPPSPGLLDGICEGSGGGGSGHERSAGGGRGRRRRCSSSSSSSVGALAAVGSAVDVVSAARPAVVDLEETAAAAAGSRKAKQQMRAITRGLNSITAYAAYG